MAKQADLISTAVQGDPVIPEENVEAAKLNYGQLRSEDPEIRAKALEGWRSLANDTSDAPVGSAHIVAATEEPGKKPSKPGIRFSLPKLRSRRDGRD